MKNAPSLSLLIMLSGLCACQPAENVQSPAKQSIAQASNTIMTLAALDGSMPNNIKLSNAKGQITDQGLEIDFQSKQHPYASVTLVPDEPYNWSEFSDFNLAFDIANKGKHSVQLNLDVSDIDGNNYTRSVNVAVSGKHTYYGKMSGHDLATPKGDENIELNFNSGLRSNPATWEGDDIQFISMWGKKNLNLNGITKISLSVQNVLHDKSITLSNIRLRKNQAKNPEFLTAIVDQYGQNAKLDFPTKIHSDEQLQLITANELATFKDTTRPDRSKFNGWKQGPKLNATGYYRSEKVDGKWWLVDPEGYLYFATGLDIIRLSNSTTITGYDFDQSHIAQKAANDLTPEDSQGLNKVSDKAVTTRFVSSDLRKNMFAWLPSYEEPLGKHFGYRRSVHSGPVKHGETFSFYSANLERKYGEQFMDKWRSVTIQRMLEWGFTSFGNWTDPSFYQNGQMPYFANGWITGDYKTVSSGNDFWAPMPDVFDPEFAVRANMTASVIAQEVKDSPWCVGVFIDNEKSFGRPDSTTAHYGIVLHTLRRDGAEVPTKAEFTRLMQQKYGDIAALNKVWDKEIADWASFNQGINSDINNEQQIADYGILLGAYAEQYFKTVHDAVAKHLPNHMYLGSRFPDWGMPIEVVKAAAKYADVVSYNSYKEGLRPDKWAFLKELDKPSIIGEFHMGASDSGLFHPGLIHAANQEDRAQMFADYMQSVIDNPYFVGAHWFQYMDSPITGRAYDGENYNVGFVNVTDTPYPEMVEAAKDVNSKIYQARFEQ
ncbi:agarase [Paraglaciecola hydrolytica]|uniref:Agarase n=1 Tax=Paraglaciecola hydrolytica TaxID=1799789 RepID=A0A136A0R3_9ALTE|nr:agarase [Paraglaciecola hydrolytica]KXI28825.1 agarase [Paraglaciecola hydrolytica]QEP52089.1 exo-beta-agarase [Paraglaciecola hydrolytica]